MSVFAYAFVFCSGWACISAIRCAVMKKPMSIKRLISELFPVALFTVALFLFAHIK